MDVLFILEAAVCLILVIFAFLALESRDLMNAVVFLSILSLFAVLAFVLMKAPDVAITEAVIGSGVVTALFVAVLMKVKKRGKETDRR